jgi:LmbE family N-acetylglucosaminyl deacetylase
VVQHLDPGAMGRRWLNLTSLASALSSASRVTLELQGLVLGSSRAELWLFDNALPRAPRVLVLAPHPDDAEIAAFGFYTRHAPRTTIVTVTAGNGGGANYQASFGADVAGQYLFKGTLRTLDSVTVPWLGGVPPERAINLGYFDERLEAMFAEPGVAIAELYRDNRDTAVYRRLNLSRLVSRAPRENRWSNLVNDLVALLRRLEPQLVIAPHPLLDSHADHAFTTVALSQALARAAGPARFLLYTNHAGADLYPYGPAGSAMSLPPRAARSCRCAASSRFRSTPRSSAKSASRWRPCTTCGRRPSQAPRRRPRCRTTCAGRHAPRSCSTSTIGMACVRWFTPFSRRMAPIMVADESWRHSRGCAL